MPRRRHPSIQTPSTEHYVPPESLAYFKTIKNDIVVQRPSGVKERQQLTESPISSSACLPSSDSLVRDLIADETEFIQDRRSDAADLRRTYQVGFIAFEESGNAPLAANRNGPLMIHLGMGSALHSHDL